VITSRPLSSGDHYSATEVIDIPVIFSTKLFKSQSYGSDQPCSDSLRIPAVNVVTLCDDRDVRPGSATWIPNEIALLWTLGFPLVTGFLRNSETFNWLVSDITVTYVQCGQIKFNFDVQMLKAGSPPASRIWINMFGVLCARDVHTFYGVPGMSIDFIMCQRCLHILLCARDMHTFYGVPGMSIDLIMCQGCPHILLFARDVYTFCCVLGMSTHFMVCQTCPQILLCARDVHSFYFMLEMFTRCVLGMSIHPAVC
jgi:hypothetical protein